MIYLNNCLTSKPADEVIEAMLPYYKEKFFFPGAFISTGSQAYKELGEFKQIIAKSLNASAETIHFTSGGTSANNIAIKGYLSENAYKGTHIICSVVDYPDILTNAAFFEQSGFEVTYLPADDDGFIDLTELEKSIRKDTILFMTTLANHTVGTVQPLAEIRQILDAAGHKIALMVDAGQAYGRMKIDVNNPEVDLLSISAHKIHGPQGVGALYVKKGTELGQFQHGINRIDPLETGGISIAAIAGFAKAVEINFEKLDENIKKLTELRDYLLARIEEEIPYTLLNGPRGEKRISHNLNISFEFIEGEAIMMMMDMQGIVVDTGSACASKGLKPNYILMAMGRTHVQSHGSVKFTLSRYNTKDEMETVVKALKKTVETLRLRSPIYNDFLEGKK